MQASRKNVSVVVICPLSWESRLGRFGVWGKYLKAANDMPLSCITIW